MRESAWHAIDAATSPTARAKQLRRAWERFIADGRVTGTRAPIAESWQRSRAAGVDPLGHRVAPVLADPGEALARWRVHPLAVASPLIRECLAPVAVAAGHLIVVADADGMLLWIEGPAGVRVAAAESMSFTEGAGWSGRGAGTNAIGTALATGHAVQVFAAEHFNEFVHGWTCSAAPIHDPHTGRVLGVIDVTGRLDAAHPHSFGCVVATAHAVEYHLRCLMQERAAWLRARDQPARLAGAHGALDALEVRAPDRPLALHRPLLKLTLLRAEPQVELDGRTLSISSAAIEVLAVLAVHPAGMTTRELATELYGEDGLPSAVWPHIFELCALLGPWIGTAPCRLSLHVESDVARVQGLLDRGAVREAAERYAGPPLPHSEAPGLAHDRDALEAALRHAVLTTDDGEALWAWTRSPSGREDLAAFERLLETLPDGDARREVVAAQVAALRAARAAR